MAQRAEHRNAIVKLVTTQRVILQKELARRMNKTDISTTLKILAEEGKIKRELIKVRLESGGLFDQYVVYANNVKYEEVLEFEKEMINKPFVSPLIENHCYAKINDDSRRGTQNGRIGRPRKVLDSNVEIVSNNNESEVHSDNILNINTYMIINNKNICIKEIESQRVVTFDEVDELHERPSGTSRRNFNTNKNHFVENEDYYLFKGEKGRKALVGLGYTDFVKLNNNNNFKMYLLTESGYLMIVKSLTDELAWKVQKELVKNYFRLKEIASKVESNLPIVKQDLAPVNQFDFMKAMFGCMETNHQDIETLKSQTELQAQEIREAKQELQEFKNKLKKIAQ